MTIWGKLMELYKDKGRFVALAMIVAITVAIYSRSMGNGFIVNWDDGLYITSNPDIQAVTLENIKRIFSSYYVGNYAPVHLLSYMVDHALWGKNFIGYISTNILLHALNGCLFYLLVARITGKDRVALIAASLFLLHPVQVESVAWVTERKTLLAMCFFLASFHQYLKFRELGSSKGKTAYALSVAFALLALLSKSVAVILPATLLLYEVSFMLGGKPKLGDLVVRLSPYAVLSIITVVIAMKSQQPQYAGGAVSFVNGSPLHHFLTMLPVFFHYFILVFWPFRLSAAYELPVRSGVDFEVIVGMVAVSVCMLIGRYLYRNRRASFFWYSVFFVALLPVSHIIPMATLMQDRYLYFPMIGMTVFVASGFNVLMDNLPDHKQIAGVLFCLLLAALSLLTYERTKVWKNAVTLWSDAAEKNPDGASSWILLAGAFLAVNENGKAESAYHRALANDPQNRVALNELGVMYGERGDLPRSRKYLERLLEIDRDSFDPNFNLGYNYLLSGETGKAEPLLKKALQLNRISGKALIALVQLSVKTGQLQEARHYYDQAAAAGIYDPSMEYDMAGIYARNRISENAIRHLGNAIRIGFSDRQAIVANKDFEFLKSSPAFQSIFKQP
jgi:tetratricopeptide (TPR) repeat protein